jgi:DNA invertase Pin-like site-specific DNA recombinase
VFREKITGTTADRPHLQKLMKAPAPGDVVITTAVDRLSRDATDLLVIAPRHAARRRRSIAGLERTGERSITAGRDSRTQARMQG